MEPLIALCDRPNVRRPRPALVLALRLAMALVALAILQRPAHAAPEPAAPSPSSAPAVVPYAALKDWLLAGIPQSQRGQRHAFVFGLFTGNMDRDPIHADAMQRVVCAWLNDALAPGDTVQVAGFEHEVRGMSKLIPLGPAREDRESVFNAFPQGPEPGSRGGKSLERSLYDLAVRAAKEPIGKPIVVVVSNGRTQSAGAKGNPAKFDDSLAGAGYGPVTREVFQLTVHGQLQDVHVARIVPRDLHGAAPPTPAPAQFDRSTWVPAAFAPTVAAESQSPSVGAARQVAAGGGERTPTWLVALSVVACLGALVAALGWARAASAHRVSAPVLAQTPPPAPMSEPVRPDHLLEAADEVEKCAGALGQVVSLAREHTDALALTVGGARQHTTTLNETVGEVGRHAGKLNQAVDAAGRQTGVLSMLANELADAVGRLDTGAQGPAPTQRDLGEVRQRVIELEALLSESDRALMEFATVLERALSLEGLDPRVRAAWVSAFDAFSASASRTGFEILAPAPGDPYISNLHRAMGVQGDPGRARFVARCESWGFRTGRKIYRTATVDITDTPPVASDKERSL